MGSDRMIKIEGLKQGDVIRAKEDNHGFEGDYIVTEAERTYPKGACPESEKGKLVIIEFMNIGTPMFFDLRTLNPEEWDQIVF